MDEASKSVEVNETSKSVEENETSKSDEVNETSVVKNENKTAKSETSESSQPNQKEDIEATKKKATLLFLQGKRSVFIRDYQAAVVSLSESCQLFSEVYPEQDDALADPYFYYGKALLEVGRSESEVLGDQVQDENESEDEDEEMEEKTENDSNSETNNGENTESSTNEEQKTSNEEQSEVEADKNGEVKENNSENGEINDLQLSWEYLELAKLIYQKKADTCKESAIKLAETFLCLGENSLESENYSVAVEDIKQALELQQKHLNEEDRRIAETYYQLGIAYSLGQNYDDAIESFKKAIAQLQKKIASLELRSKMGDKKTEEEEKDAFYTMDGEIKEIQAVIKEVDEKIKDMIESKNQVKAELLKQVYKDDQSGSTSTSSNAAGSSSSSSIPAKDISHLIKKKRKNDDEETNQEKKLKTEN